MSSPVKTDCAEHFGTITSGILNDFITNVNRLPDQLEAPNLEERQMEAFYVDTFRKISVEYNDFVKKYPLCRTNAVLGRRYDAYDTLNKLRIMWMGGREAPHEFLGGFGADAHGLDVPAIFAPIFGGLIWKPLFPIFIGLAGLRSLIYSNSDLEYIE